MCLIHTQRIKLVILYVRTSFVRRCFMYKNLRKIFSRLKNHFKKKKIKLKKCVKIVASTTCLFFII
jgi:hypothetical protein